jgi:hypothetical protein
VRSFPLFKDCFLLPILNYSQLFCRCTLLLLLLLQRTLEPLQRVLQQHGDGHGPHAPGHRRDEPGHLHRLVEAHVAHEPVATLLGGVLRRPPCTASSLHPPQQAVLLLVSERRRHWSARWRRSDWAEPTRTRDMVAPISPAGVPTRVRARV